MAETVEFQPYDAFYLFCVGESVTFDTAWRASCFIDRICFSDQCNEPAFAENRAKMHAAIQRGIDAGHILLSASGDLSQSDLRGRFDDRRDAGLNEFDASEEVEAFLLSQTWPVVCDSKLSP
ncbi:MAG: hypothetical protein ACI9G1_001482 [Pirellulaceae bacterium]|jgi:hypothetical protein